MNRLTKLTAMLGLTVSLSAPALAANFVGNYTAHQAVSNHLIGQDYRLSLPGVGLYNQVGLAMYDLAEDDDDFHQVDDKAEAFADVYVTFAVITKYYIDNPEQARNLNFDPTQVTLKDYLQDVIRACNAGNFAVTPEQVSKDLGSPLTGKENRQVYTYQRDFRNLCTLAKQYLNLYNLPEFQSYLKLYQEYSEYVYQAYKTQGANYGFPLSYKSITDGTIEDIARQRFQYDNPRGYRILKNFDEYVYENRAFYNALNAR
ncbi:hypothetical protein CJP74_03545 [Psittacicella melopsittaci]|uniref:Uncharacterized protein n=1 Tax=Psittacicella melopsittaci TaxID=2028576 RepID=A0A3A1Y9H1_9GAMM|nr:hypothetical protein [Psittacicella melopsittaci]RIY32784.1 hypothetical protein CJP74_03545 [Psittacicella melopsittaci]